jgi:hypothetical protein
MTKAGLEPCGGVSLAIRHKRDRRLLVARGARCKHLGNEVATVIGMDVVALMGTLVLAAAFTGSRRCVARRA